MNKSSQQKLEEETNDSARRKRERTVGILNGPKKVQVKMKKNGEKSKYFILMSKLH